MSIDLEEWKKLEPLYESVCFKLDVIEERFREGLEYAFKLGFKRGAEQEKQLRDVLKKILDHLSDEDEEGLLEHVEIIADARALLAKTGGE